MNRIVLGICLAFVLLVGAFALFFMNEPEPAPEPAAEVRPAPAPAPAPPPRVEEPAPAPEPARPAAAPKAAPKPAPVVEAPAAVPVDRGTLQIDSDVAGARVFINREYAGVTPLTVPDLALGNVAINVSAQGYDSVSQDVEVIAGTRDVMFRFKEVRLDTRIPVVHKHRMGSCRGTLIATPAGLRYETTNKEDGFTTAFADLELFEVNYLEKNLRVQARKGRRFDFTDPEGNADHLFVFHRDVEKAREQLKKGDAPASQ